MLHAALARGDVITRSVALEVARWTAKIPEEYRDEAENILITAAAAGAGLRALAAICAEIRARVAPPDPDGPGGVASFLRRTMLGQGLGGPSLPLDVGQP